MIPLPSSATALAVGIAAVAGLAVGAGIASQAGEVELLRCQNAHMEYIDTATRSAALALTAAHARSDELTRSLASARQRAAQLTEERGHEIQNATTGVACLRDPVLRLLDGAPGIRVAGIAGTGGGAAGTHARAATDTHIAGWIVTAGGQYEECRRRLAALIDWHTAGGAHDAND
jgi:hypothetical protein